jgi:hypothetical protein
MPLEQELATFEAMKPNLLLNHNGKFALIKDSEFIGAFDNADNAYNEGVRRFGRDSFLVKHVAVSEETYRNFALFTGMMNARL